METEHVEGVSWVLRVGKLPSVYVWATWLITMLFGLPLLVGGTLYHIGWLSHLYTAICFGWVFLWIGYGICQTKARGG